MYKNFRRPGYMEADRTNVEQFRQTCFDAINIAKVKYLKKQGQILTDRNTSQKAYWKILNRATNRCKVPKVSPLLIDNIFDIDCGEKATKINEYFPQQYKPNVNDSVLPHLEVLSETRIRTIEITIIDIKMILNLYKPY